MRPADTRVVCLISKHLEHFLPSIREEMSLGWRSFYWCNSRRETFGKTLVFTEEPEWTPARTKQCSADWREGTRVFQEVC